MSLEAIVMHSRSITVAFILLVFGVLAFSGCREKRRAGPDLSNPKAAALTFTTALENGDIATARMASNASGMEKELIESMAQSAAGIKKLQTAATAKFGDQAQQVLQQQSLNVTKNLSTAEVEAGDQRATVRSRDGRDVLQLQKIDGLWRVDVGALIKGKDVTKVVPFFRAAGAAATEIAGDIDRGKITTVDQARQEMNTRIMMLMPRMIQEQYEASTRPAVEIPGL